MKMKYNKYNKVMGLAMLALTFTACTDTWDDHYEVPAVGDGTSIWQTIKANDNLSNFAAVLEATGYDKALAGSQVFTVYAPVNDNFTEADANELISLYNAEKQAGKKDRDNSAVKEFVQNHIALYNHSLRDKADSVTMMNGKYKVMSEGMLSNSKMLTWNEQKSNGILFTMAEPVNFFRNVFEYLSNDADISEVGDFLTDPTYNHYEFVPYQSVPGGIIDGKTWYLDSVKVITNELFGEIGRINSEDSTYWMVVPTNDVWNQLVAEYEPYFNYDDKVDKRDSLAYTQARLAVLRGTAFSRTKNAKLVDGEYVWNQDSVLSVNATDYSRRTYKDQCYYQYTKPFDEGGVFSGTAVECSNGKVIKSAVWPIDKRQTFLQDVIIEGESRNYRDGINETTTADPVEISVPTSNEFYGKVSQHKYLLVHPKYFSAAEVRYKIPNLLSNVGYDIYVVFAPTMTLESYDRLDLDVPVKFTASYNYHQQDGTKSREQNLRVPTDYEGYDAAVRGTGRYFQTIAGVVDTVLVASNIQIPTCSWGLDNPQVILTLKTALTSAERDAGTFTDRMRIDCVIFKPHEETATEE